MEQPPGFPPFYDESINVLTEKVARGYYTFLSPWWDDISGSSKDLITNLLTVDPDKRYTIDEFLAHPWCNQRPAPPNLEPKIVEQILAGHQVTMPKAAPVARQGNLAVQQSNVPVDSPLLAETRIRRDGAQTPAAFMREAFDITYAVHRMGEEGQRRGAGGRGFLNDLNEADEEEDDEAILEETRRKYGAGVSKIIEDQRAAAVAAAQAGKTQQPSGQYHGWGGADRKQAEAVLYDGRAGNRDRGRRQNGRGNGFDLKLDNATLLGRRAKGGPGLSLGSLPPTGAASPMRVD